MTECFCKNSIGMGPPTHYQYRVEAMDGEPRIYGAEYRQAQAGQYQSAKSAVEGPNASHDVAVGSCDLDL